MHLVTVQDERVKVFPVVRVTGGDCCLGSVGGLTRGLIKGDNKVVSLRDLLPSATEVAVINDSTNMKTRNLSSGEK